MGKKALHDEMMYQATMSIARRMAEEWLITRDEYARLDRIFVEKYRPIIGSMTAKQG